MIGWSEDHVAAIGSQTQYFGIVDGTWLNWRPGGALRWKAKTAGWEGRGVVHAKPAPSRL
jgi:hypothetical protein